MFVGREEELKTLLNLLNRKKASFVAIRGRRRIGKSRLIAEFSKHFEKKLMFTGIPPTKGITDQIQKEEFSRQMGEQGLPQLKSKDWSELFWILGKEVEKGRVLIALDEIAWMGSKDPAFLGKLKIAWDRFFEKNPKLVLIVASSIASWIDENILNSTGFFGRIDLTLTLRELSIKDCVKFWRKKGISSYEKLKLLSVTGGVPKYLESIHPEWTAEENIQRLCFSEEGLLFNEFDRIFNDLFSKKNETVKDIVKVLASTSSLTQGEICDKIQRSNGRQISEYIRDLTKSGFISADYTWDLKTGKTGNLRKYRLSDNYLRFYLKYIGPNKEKIIKGKFKKSSVFSSTSWDIIMGFQFENLVVNNGWDLFPLLYIRPEEYDYDGPYFQTKTRERKGCQIDYLIQAKNTLYICEVKFSRNPIGVEVIEEMKRKIKALGIPKHVSYRPVLIHVGSVKDEVILQDYFDSIIDWTTLIS
ncbi:MAG: AAA family ATPase [Chlamydiales bacterium]|nr:AAA family ATPase [Chlamydiales bacterium]